ncbi:MAG: GH3 auxin-responsive promoter family protein, partial [Bacteroidota bacterium]
MKIKSFLAKPFAGYIYKNIQRSKNTAIFDQESCLKSLINTGKLTEIGKEMRLSEAQQYREFREAVPLRDYEQFRHYINRIIEGKHNVLWKGRPMYFAKTSGTTSGV